MPQMSPMKWMLIFLFSLLNLFISMLIMNTIYLELNYKDLIYYSLIKWKWLW